MYKAIKNEFIAYGYFIWPIELAIARRYVKFEEIEFDMTIQIPERIMELLELYYLPESEQGPESQIELEDDESEIPAMPKQPKLLNELDKEGVQLFNLPENPKSGPYKVKVNGEAPIFDNSSRLKTSMPSDTQQSEGNSNSNRGFNLKKSFYRFVSFLKRRI
jgi:hypothetical protein